MRNLIPLDAGLARAAWVEGSLKRSLTNLLLIGLWLWLYQPLFDYLGLIFSREDFRTNQLILVGVLALIAVQVHQGRLRPRLDAPLHLAWPALSLVVGGSVCFLLVERFLDVNTISASLFVLAGYGLLGLWLRPDRWRQGLPAAMLLMATLPFGEHLQTFIGYPMRIATAALVRDGLAASGVASVGVDTILVFENGVSHVDLPCSGVKSLWTGLIFLTAATWIERRPLNGRWLLIALVMVGLLFVANLTRVAVLVVTGPVLNWQLLAEMLHVPLGVLGFVGACAAAVGLLRRVTPQADDSRRETENPPHPTWLAPLLATTLLAMALLYTPRPQTGLSGPPPTLAFPPELTIEPLPLKPDEIVWLTRDGAEAAERLRFEWRGVTGSMILITSNTWRGHHRPERCFEVYGLSLDDSHTHLVAADFPLRFVRLGRGQGQSLLSASYWFQSTSQTTDDYASRIWADLKPRRDRWLLVSILFDDTYDPNAPDIRALYLALHEAVGRYLQGVEPKPDSSRNDENASFVPFRGGSQSFVVRRPSFVVFSTEVKPYEPISD